MSDTVIQVENLGKKYIIGHQQEGNSRYVALRDVLSDGARALGQRLRYPGKPRVNPNQEEFWALKDVSFEVKRGEVVGIIGRNGAGKSTLLKILSRITEPTEGRVRLRGRVASLLEVGTGFHPELTGRENIFLNGAILGMSRVEINRKFDEIVEFAEVSRFLDTPVKRYSSGMYVRLAFAVAAHLEPEILVVDEVLAVGDSAFQKKCLGKMKDVGKSGKTVLFVSHNIASISALCERSILLKQGFLAMEGDCEKVIAQYLGNQSEYDKSESILDLEDHLGRQPSSQKILRRLEVFCDGKGSTNLSMGGRLEIITEFKSDTPIKNFHFGLSIEDLTGQRLIVFSPTQQQPDLFPEMLQSGTIACNIPSLKLLPGAYFITVIVANSMGNLDCISPATQLTIEFADVFKTGIAPSNRHGIFYAHATWLLDY